MYGGHITDAWDRKLCATYLNAYLKEELLDSLNLFPKFEVPSSGFSYKQYLEYIEEQLASETPAAYVSATQLTFEPWHGASAAWGVSAGHGCRYRHLAYLGRPCSRRTWLRGAITSASPALQGLHPNSEISFMTMQADALFSAVGELQPRAGGVAGGMSLQARPAPRRTS